MLEVKPKAVRWEPPTDLKEVQVGRWRIVHRYQSKPVAYPMYKQGGMDYVRVASAKETFLQQQDDDGVWHDWMTDQPPYWYAMANYGKLASGRVLVLGLGLGLVLRPLAKNSNVESVVVCERQPEVIEMVWEQLNLDGRFELRQGDFFDLDWSGTTFNTVIADIWTGKTADPELQEVFLKAYDKINSQWPTATAWYHSVDPWAKELTRRKHAHVLTPNRVALLAAMSQEWQRA